MNKPLVVSIPHKLGQQEAVSRLKRGFTTARASYSQFIAIDEEVWVDNRLTFRARALGQSCAGLIDVQEDHVRLEVTLPWLLARIAERVIPTIRREGTLLLDKK